MFSSRRIDYVPYNAEALRGKGLVVTEHEDLGLAIVRYHKGDNEWKTRTHGECDRTDSTVRKHRSVVYSLNTGLPVCVAPVRRITQDEASSAMFRNSNDDNWVVTEYLDGTMINVFWNPNLNPETGDPFGWTLSSRSKIHATCRFTSDRLFRDLFEEARVHSGVLYETLNTRLCYTFILVHPETRRVIHYQAPRIVLVSVVRCVPVSSSGANDGSEEMRLSAESLTWDQMVVESRRIVPVDEGHPEILPRRATIPARNILSYSLEEDVTKTLSGWVITNRETLWSRVRILTDGFTECANLRGDTASRRTNYLRLMSLDPRGDTIRKYAALYPEEEDAIRELGETVKATVNELIQNYIDRHVKKTKEHNDLPHWARRPIWDLHGRYLRTRVPIREAEVLGYFRDISPSFVNRMLRNREKENMKNRERHVQASAAAGAAAAAPASASVAVAASASAAAT